MASLVLIEATAQAGRLQELVNFYERNFHHSQGRDGFQSAAAYVGDIDETVVVTQLWDSKADFESYLGWRETAGSVAEFQSLVAGEPVIRFFESIGPD